MVSDNHWKKTLYRAIATPSIHIMKALFPNEYGMDSPGITDRHIEYPWVIANIKPYATVLDIGCSGSMLPFLLQALGCNVYGIDIRPFKEATFAFSQEDITDSMFPNESFEIITAVSTLEHIKDDFKAVNEIYRILEPNGTFLMTVPYLYGGYKKTKFHRFYDGYRLDKLLEKFDHTINYRVSPEGNYELALVRATK